MTDWTRLIGASASAATCSPHAAIATRIPSVHQRLLNSAIVLLTGRRHSTAGAPAAPFCLNRKPRLATTEHARASARPSWTENGTPDGR